MKILTSLLLLFTAALAPGQGTAFTYQGRLNDTNGPASGTYDLTLTLFNAPTGGAVIGPSNVASGLVITNGLFTVTPDFGPQFNGLDRWLEIAVRTNGGSNYTLLSPRQKLTPTPYAFYAPQAGTATTAFGVTADAVGSSGLQASSVTSDKIADGSIMAADVNSASFSNTFWKVNGNAGANPANGAFLGTADNLPVELRANGARVLRLEPDAPGVISFISAPNVIGGWAGNQVTNGAIGATVWGGGFDFAGDYGNIVGADFGTVSGGRQNTAGGAEATVAGGRANTASGGNATISGGYANTVMGGVATVAGGVGNTTVSDSSTVSGGTQNTIQTNSPDTTIGGGAYNTVSSNSWRGTIGGGFANTVGAPEGTVAGGAFNNALAFSATIGGGGGNAVSGAWSTIAGGRDNVLTNADYSAIGGGVQNSIQTNAAFSAIGGGAFNVVQSNAYRGTVGGGWVNTIGAPEGTVAGGAFNSARGFSATIGGGGGNAASGEWSTIAGGRDNQLANALYATIGGGVQNAIQTNAAYSTIGGGVQNTIQSNGFGATIPGGWLNSAADFAFAAGRRAKANHTGAFVWADATDADFASTGTNQFLVRAGGGVRMETGGAGMTLDGVNVLSGTVPSASLAGTYSGAVVFSNSGNNFTGNGANLTALNASQLASGTVPDARLSANVSFLGAGIDSAEITDGTIAPVDLNLTTFNTTFWRAAGNAGTAPGTQFLGTTDNQPLEFKVNATRALRLEPRPNSSPNFLAGSPSNSVAAGNDGATISGGGNATNPNSVGSSAGTIGGGIGNGIQVNSASSTVSGGEFNRIGANSPNASIGGGTQNRILQTGYSSTIGGGYQNQIGTNSGNSTISGGFTNSIASDAVSATIGGGGLNQIVSGGTGAVIGGGGFNRASLYGTVPGGGFNDALGTYSLAAGYRAKANHIGAFVWGDSTDADFSSTGNNQFLIRASGGVGIGTTNPQAQLHLYSQTPVTTLRLQSAFGFGAGRIEFLSDPQGSGSEWRPGYIQSTDNGGFAGGLSFVVNGSGFANRFAEIEVMRIVNGAVGIGTATPVSALQVIGTVTATAFNPPSDRNLKENFAPVSPREVLEKVAALPISRWNFKGDAATPHVGPMAQDFHAAFSLGTDERHIATVDADGVALAAIQGLNQKVEEKDARIAELERRLEKLERLMNRENGGAR